MNVLFHGEQENNFARTMVHVFALAGNKHMTTEEMYSYFVRIKGLPKKHSSDKYSDIRTYRHNWNKLAVSYNVPVHPFGQDNCRLIKPHRLCTERTSRGKEFWVERSLAERLFSGQCPVQEKKDDPPVVVKQESKPEPPVPKEPELFTDFEQLLDAPMTFDDESSTGKRDMATQTDDLMYWDDCSPDGSTLEEFMATLAADPLMMELEPWPPVDYANFEFLEVGGCMGV